MFFFSQVDDVGALCLAIALDALGEASLEAVTHCTGLDVGIGAEQRLTPVSYTHLTLPTICSV